MEFKEGTQILREEVKKVLIESDWNLKGNTVQYRGLRRLCINRIRLEFKDYSGNDKRSEQSVLIESDWNLK